MLTSSDDSPIMNRFAFNFLNAVQAAIDWILSDTFPRFENLKVVFSEGYIGWMPFAFEHCQRSYETHAHWTDHPLKVAPKEFIHDHVYGSFIEDHFGASQIETIGLNNVMVEADYPHPDGLWPNTQKVVEEHLRHLTPEKQKRVMRTNAEELFHLDLPDV